MFFYVGHLFPLSRRQEKKTYFFSRMKTNVVLIAELPFKYCFLALTLPAFINVFFYVMTVSKFPRYLLACPISELKINCVQHQMLKRQNLYFLNFFY